MAENRTSSTAWCFMKTLGSGAFGEVSLWKHKEKQQAVAIKQCFANLNQMNPGQIVKLNTRWKQEALWMSQLNEPNIVRACPEICPELLEEINSKSTNTLEAIAMEYCEGGNLRTKLQHIDNLNGLIEYDVRAVLRAVGNAICYLHSQKITHRDIKPENIVLKYGANGDTVYKLTDIGFARVLSNSTIEASMVGSKNYFAPEIVEFGEYTNTVDFWSLGVLAFEIICGVYPFLQKAELFAIISAIKGKPPGCVAVTLTATGELQYFDDLFPENQLSVEFHKAILPWIRSALDKNRRTRGHNPDGKLTFFEDLHLALNTRVLTVFWLNTCRSFSYTLDNSSTMNSLYQMLENDIGISKPLIRIILPSTNQVRQLRPETKPIELIDERLAAEDRPMLYIFTFGGNGLCNPEDPKISEIIQQSNVPALEAMRPQCTEQLRHSVFSVCRDELKRMHSCYEALEELMLSLDDHLVSHQHHWKMFQDNIRILTGQVAQFEDMVNNGKEVLESSQNRNLQTNEWETVVQEFRILIAQTEGINEQYKKLLTSVREFLKKIKSSPLTKQLQSFILPKSFQNDHSPQLLNTPLYDVLNLRNMFFIEAKKILQQNETPSINEPILQIWIEAEGTVKTVANYQLRLNDFQTRLNVKTREYIEFVKDFNMEQLTDQMDTMDIESVSSRDLTEENEKLRKMIESMLYFEQN